MKQNILYLAGKCTGLSIKEMTQWRNEFDFKLSNRTDKFHIVSPTDFYSFEEKKHKTEREIMEYDLFIVKHSTLIVVNLDYPNSLGTAIELYEANKHCGIPVIGFGTVVNHPWIEECVNVKFDTMDEVIDYVMEFYVPHM